MLFSTILPILAILSPALARPARGPPRHARREVTTTSTAQVLASAGQPYTTIWRDITVTIEPTTTTTAAAAGSTPPPSGGAPAGEATTLLDLHNTFRAKYGANALRWSSELATFAANYAGGCDFAHSSGPYGENLAAGYGEGYTSTSAFNRWADEASKYDYNSPGYTSAASHFTQLVWEETTEVGCAVAQCGEGTIFADTAGQPTSYVVCECPPLSQ